MSESSNIEMASVGSSFIAKVGYCQASGVLRIEFQESGVYDYQNVSQTVYDGLMKASSKGEFFSRCIKKKFAYRKIN